MPQGTQIREQLKKMVKERGLDASIRVSRSGCLDLCKDGPNVLLMPDNKWFAGVLPDNLEIIMREACLPPGLPAGRDRQAQKGLS